MVELIKGFANGEDIDTYEPPCLLEKSWAELRRCSIRSGKSAGPMGRIRVFAHFLYTTL